MGRRLVRPSAAKHTKATMSHRVDLGSCYVLLVSGALGNEVGLCWGIQPVPVRGSGPSVHGKVGPRRAGGWCNKERRPGLVSNSATICAG